VVFASRLVVQTQLYKAPTYPAFLALANEAAGLNAPAAMTGTPGKPGASAGMSHLFKQRDKDNDRKLTRDELPSALFDRLERRQRRLRQRGGVGGALEIAMTQVKASGGA
jgi:hypothetical protein